MHFVCLQLTVCSYHTMHMCQSESTLHSCLNVKEPFALNKRDIWSLSNCNGIGTHNHLVRKQTVNLLVKLANDSAMLWVLICTVHLTVCSYHVTYVFQSESTLYSCLNFKESLAWNRHDIWSLSDWKENRNYYHLVPKQLFRQTG